MPGEASWAPAAAGERGAPIYQGVMTDITARKEAELRLAENESRSRTLLEHLPVVAYMTEHEAEPAIRAFLTKMYDDSRRGSSY